MGETLHKGSPMLRPLNPIVMNAASGIAGIAALITLVGGFFLYGWNLAGGMLAGVVGVALLTAPFPRTPIATIVAGLIGTALLILGWIVS